MADKSFLPTGILIFCIGATLGAVAALIWSGSNAGEEPFKEMTASVNTLTQELDTLRLDYEKLESAHKNLEEVYDQERSAAAKMGREKVPREHEGGSEIEGDDDLLEGTDLPVAFSTWNNEPSLRLEDWSEAAQDAGDLTRARSAGIGGGQSAEMGAIEKRALRRYRKFRSRLEAASPGLSGHPIVFVNMMASHLIHAGKALENWQIDEIKAIGDAFETAREQLNQQIEAGTIYLGTEKKLRDIQLRIEAMNRIVDDVLTQAQWKVLFDPSTKGLLYYDVYQIGGLELERPNSSVYWRVDKAKARQHLEIFLTTEWGIEKGSLPLISHLIDEWIETVSSLPKGPHHPTSALHINEVMPSVITHVEFQKKILDALAHEVEIRETIISNPVFVVFPGLES